MTNPLKTYTASNDSRWVGTVNKDMIDEYVASINKRDFVRISRLPYFTNRKKNTDGEFVYFLDRMVSEPWP